MNPPKLAICVALAAAIGCGDRPASQVPASGQSDAAAPPRLSAAPSEYMPPDDYVYVVLPRSGGIYVNTRAVSPEQLAPLLRVVFEQREPRSLFVHFCPGGSAAELRFVVDAAASVQVRTFDLLRSKVAAPGWAPPCTGYRAAPEASPPSGKP